MDASNGQVLRRGLKISGAGVARWSRIAGLVLVVDAVLLALVFVNAGRHDYVATWFLAIYMLVSFKIHVLSIVGAWQFLTGRVSVFVDAYGHLIVVSKLINQIPLNEIVWVEVFDDPRLDCVKLHKRDGRERIILSGYFEGGGPAFLRLIGKPGTPPGSQGPSGE